MRNDRYKSILSNEQLRDTSILIVGVGAIGKNLAEQLAAMGFGDIAICDFDRVEDVNLGTQGFKKEDLGKNKVDVVASNCLKLNPEMNIFSCNNAFEKPMSEGFKVIFMCVDSMETRMEIMESAGKDSFVVDGRMGMQTINIISPEDLEHYKLAWFTDEEAESAPCTMKSTLYCASIAAGLMISLLVKYVNKQEIPFRVTMSLIDYTISVEE